ncbi:MAG: hypothetical protein LBS05_05420 [Tannerellaceae bacterium]|jgi:hypothetical protein|nr:hypothetical protein [Tannerellaceae bacterium]
MNKLFVVIFGASMTLASLECYAQDKQDGSFDKEMFLVRRNAFIAAELGLTPQEAGLFLPLLEELQEKKYEAGHKCRRLSKEIKQKKKPNNADYLNTIDECIGVGIKEAELEREYYEKFKKVLSPEKLYKYKEVEYRFAREFVKNSEKQPERTRGGGNRNKSQ